MKNLITSLALVVTVLGFSQSKIINGMVVKETTKVENIVIEVTVDSAQEIESTFNAEDIEEIFESSGDNKTMSFKIICNSLNNKTGYKSSVSYKIDGNTNESATFFKHVDRIRGAAIKYYENKN